ncbi:hypothetical protein LB572_30865 [Mesorhizobium sp. BH1-1-5]|uniref:hypothetical protein n=1 Tax=Mesorhizobium sp. BH1-1-5 TaxID=2876661 RepID=UPI001CD01D4C|nr:hypothetical protein [Mesorhizobium sp. BH1-1-5]MBZ9991500.1 hypothetical protein [Mesorhizobium sp. BH1-1-5]
MNVTDRRSPQSPRRFSGRLAALIGCGCCLIAIAIASVASVTSSAAWDPGSLAVNTAGKEQRIAPGPGIDFACKGQNWGHESRECLAAIINRTQSGRQRPIRIIADDGGGSQAQ